MQRLSTRGIPGRERLAFVHDIVGRHAAGMRFDPRDSADFNADFEIMPLPDGTLLGEAAYDAFEGRRTPDLLTDGRDGYQLMLPDVGYETEIDGGSTVAVEAGGLLVLDQGVSFRCRLPAVRFDVIALSRARMAALVPGLTSRAYRIARRNAAGLDLFAGYARLLRKELPATPQAQRLAGEHLHQLAALVLTGMTEDAPPVSSGSIGAARLALVKRDIRSRLGDPDLSIEQVARRQSITPRYIQRLFAAEGTSFSDHVRERRLARAHRRLREDTHASIAAIAFEAGFGDLSSFNRAFRRRYGATPSQVRGEALRLGD